MGVTIFAKGDIQNEACDIAIYRKELAESNDPGFAAYCSRYLTGPQTELHICYSTWSTLLSFMGLSKFENEGAIDPETLGMGISYLQLQERLGADIDLQFVPILRNIVARARELGSEVVFG